MREDGFLQVVATVVALGALVVAGALAASGSFADPVNISRCAVLLAWTAGLWGLAAQLRRRARHERRLQILAIERLVGVLREQ